jgi:aldehyde dehydrogenase (NAD+)
MQDLQSLLTKQSVFFREEAFISIDFRIKMLQKLKESIQKNEDKINEALKNDLGKSAFESFTTEVGFVLHEIDYVKRHLKKWAKRKKVKTPQKIFFFSRSYVEPKPRGQVLIYAPWNYPFQLVISPLVGAIAAGNTVVVKPSEHAENTAILLDELISEIFPEKYVTVVRGGAEVAQQLSELDWDMVFFTGSTEVGRKVYENAAKKLTPVLLELGGKCPAIIHKDANLSVSVRRLVWAKFINAGQTCVAPDYLLVHKNSKDKVIKLLKKEINQQLGKNNKESAAFGRIINKTHFDRLNSLLEQTEIIFGGETDAEALYISPTLIDEPSVSHPLMKEEIFGPILPIISYESIDDAIRFINRNNPPLALYAFCSSNKTFDFVERHTSSGAIVKNDAILQLANLNLPFGGVRQSGIGRYHGKYSFEAFSEMRAFLNHYTTYDPKLRYPPYTEKKWKLIKQALK